MAVVCVVALPALVKGKEGVAIYRVTLYMALAFSNVVKLTNV